MATVGSILRTDFKTVDKRDGLRSVLGWLRGDVKAAPVVVDGDKPIGIVNERGMVQRRLDDKAKLEAHTLITSSIPLTATLDEAAHRMAEFRASYVPVADERGQVAGYVTALDVARELDQGYVARDVCLPVQTLRERGRMGEALHLFTQEYVPYLPVLDAGGRVSGVLPRRALLRIESNVGNSGRKDAGGESRDLFDGDVAGFMDTTPTTLPAAASFHEVIDRVSADGYAIVSKEDGSVLGLVTPETLMRRV